VRVPRTDVGSTVTRLRGGTGFHPERRNLSRASGHAALESSGDHG